MRHHIHKQSASLEDIAAELTTHGKLLADLETDLCALLALAMEDPERSLEVPVRVYSATDQQGTTITLQLPLKYAVLCKRQELLDSRTTAQALVEQMTDACHRLTSYEIMRDPPPMPTMVGPGRVA